MNKSNDDALSQVNFDSDYHQRAWEEFTRLTKEEHAIFNQFARKYFIKTKQHWRIT